MWRTGSYTVAIEGHVDGIAIENDKVNLRRGGMEIVKLSYLSDLDGKTTRRNPTDTKPEHSIAVQPSPVKTAEWIKIKSAHTHLNYVFVDLEWELTLFPCHMRTIYHGPATPFTESDVTLAREHRRAGVECSWTGPSSEFTIRGLRNEEHIKCSFAYPTKKPQNRRLRSSTRNKLQWPSIRRPRYNPIKSSRCSASSMKEDVIRVESIYFRAF